MTTPREMMLQPALQAYPEETRLMGYLVLAYGELDITLSHCAALALGQKWELLHALQSIRSEGRRIQAAEDKAKLAFDRLGLGERYDEALRAIRYCRTIRNQYAHSQFGFAPDQPGLLFVNAETAFEAPLKQLQWRGISVDLLKKQEEYFVYTRMCLVSLELALGQVGKRRPVDWKAPQQQEPPPAFLWVAT